jgi:hypothetical protein
LKARIFPSVILVLIFFCHALGQIVTTHESANQLSKIGSVGQELKGNLMDCFFVLNCEFADSLSRQNTIATLGKRISDTDSQYAQTEWQLLKPFSVGGHNNIVFYTVPNPHYVHSTFKFVYNIKQNNYYNLRGISVDSLNALLDTEDFHLVYDGEILSYCKFVTILMYPDNYIKFIADIKQLLLDAVSMELYSYYDLDKIIDFYKIKVELPSITHDGNLINIFYFAANGDDIVKIKMTLKGKKILGYKEEKIGEVPYWYGFGYRQW